MKTILPIFMFLLSGILSSVTQNQAEKKTANNFVPYEKPAFDENDIELMEYRRMKAHWVCQQQDILQSQYAVIEAYKKAAK